MEKDFCGEDSMNILITVHSYWPHKDGVQYVTQYLAEGLADRGHDVVVITSVKNKEEVGEEIRNKVKIIRVFLTARYSVLYKGKTDYINIIDCYLEKADVLINCCAQSPINNLLLGKLKTISCKKVLYLHGIHRFNYQNNGSNDLHYYIKHSLLNARWFLFYLLHRTAFCNYDLMVDIYEGSDAFSFFDKLGIKTNRTIINNAVEDFSRVEDKQIVSIPNKYFLCVANFVEHKNQKFLIEAFEKVKNKQGFKLVLIGGSSDYSKKLLGCVHAMGLDEDIIILEDLNRETTATYIKHCYCAVMSSHFEVYPIFLCEALSCGHPFISTNVGYVNSIPGGIVVDTIDDFSYQIQFAIDNPDYITSLGCKGLDYANKNFDQQTKVIELEKAINDLLINVNNGDGHNA